MPRLIPHRRGRLRPLIAVSARTLHRPRSSAKGVNLIPTKDGTLQLTYLSRALVDSMTALPGGGRQPYHGPPVKPYQNPSQGDHS
jgi:hypothetical protein